MCSQGPFVSGNQTDGNVVAAETRYTLFLTLSQHVSEGCGIDQCGKESPLSLTTWAGTVGETWLPQAILAEDTQDTCACTHIHTISDIYTHTYIHTYTYICTYTLKTYIHTCTLTHMYTHTHSQTYIHTYTLTHMYTHLHILADIYTHTYTLTHVYTHTHITCTHWKRSGKKAELISPLKEHKPL